MSNLEFPSTAPSAQSVFYRTYSKRQSDGQRESFGNTVERTQTGLAKVGKMSSLDSEVCREMMERQITFPSGRWMWVGGTAWAEKPENVSGCYNCVSISPESWEDFGYVMNILMQGTGVGFVAGENVERLPRLKRHIDLDITEGFGELPPTDDTKVTKLPGCNEIRITVGDSRQGWCSALVKLLELASPQRCKVKSIVVRLDLRRVRKPGAAIKGFGGVANPNDLTTFFTEIVSRLNEVLASGGKLTSLDVAWIMCRIGLVVVAGNVRRSALIGQFMEGDPAAQAKMGMWVEGDDGQWRIDPARDALRMANFTEVYLRKPDYPTVLRSVQNQLESGEGALQYAPEAIARSAGIPAGEIRNAFLASFEPGSSVSPEELLRQHFASQGEESSSQRVKYAMESYGLNPCGEIIMHNNKCNLSEVHLNQIDPFDLGTQIAAFEAGGLTVAALLHQDFVYPSFKESRAVDPIVGASFTGGFDFFVNLFGVEWLKWWAAGRTRDWGVEEPVSRANAVYQDVISASIAWDSPGQPWWSKKPEELDKVTISLGELFATVEEAYLTLWREVVATTVKSYCQEHNLKCPNRFTTIQPAGSKSLLTGASPGWHPPKSTRFIRRITFSAYHPVAMAGMDFGYTVVPSQSCRDSDGALLDDIHDPRAIEWLLEIPTEVPWADLADAAGVDVGALPVESQFDFFMQCQKYYTQHNTSATLEARREDAPKLAHLIYDAIQNDEGYISAAILARFDDHQAFPRLPFEPVSEELYNSLQAGVLSRRETDDFYALMNRYEKYQFVADSESKAAECTASKCEIKAAMGDAPKK